MEYLAEKASGLRVVQAAGRGPDSLEKGPRRAAEGAALLLGRDREAVEDVRLGGVAPAAWYFGLLGFWAGALLYGSQFMLLNIGTLKVISLNDTRLLHRNGETA